MNFVVIIHLLKGRQRWDTSISSNNNWLCVGTYLIDMYATNNINLLLYEVRHDNWCVLIHIIIKQKVMEYEKLYTHNVVYELVHSTIDFPHWHRKN